MSFGFIPVIVLTFYEYNSFYPASTVHNTAYARTCYVVSKVHFFADWRRNFCGNGVKLNQKRQTVARKQGQKDRQKLFRA